MPLEVLADEWLALPSRPALWLIVPPPFGKAPPRWFAGANRMGPQIQAVASSRAAAVPPARDGACGAVVADLLLNHVGLVLAGKARGLNPRAGQPAAHELLGQSVRHLGRGAKIARLSGWAGAATYTAGTRVVSREQAF